MYFSQVINNRVNFVSVQREFRTNEGSTDYATIPEVTLAGDFVIEFDFLTSSSTNQIILGDSHTSTIYLNVSSIGFSVYMSGASDIFTFGGTTPLDGNLHKIKYQMIGTSMEVFVDGESLGVKSVVPYTSPVGLRLYSSNSVTNNNLSGILANLKIYDNGTLIRDYPINDNSSTIRDLANGQDGTIINGNAADWGLFDRQANGDWKGNGLIVPPWDSVDQILVIA